MHPINPKARHAILLIWVVLALDLVSFASSFLQYDLLRAIAGGERVAPAVAAANDTRQSIVGILHFIAFAASAVFFLRWFNAAYHVLLQKVSTLSRSEGWAIGSWFVLFLNLALPYQMMREMHTHARDSLLAGGNSEGAALKTQILGWWWALWLVSNIFGQISVQYALDARTLDQLITGTAISMAASLIAIPLALVTIRMIKNYARIEPRVEEFPDRA